MTMLLAGGATNPAPLWEGNSGTGPTSLAAGTMILFRPPTVTPATPAYLSVRATASALSAGQQVEVVCYLLDGVNGKPKTKAWGVPITVGVIGTTTQCEAANVNALPSVDYVLGVLNPSTNAGGVTLNTHAPAKGLIENLGGLGRYGLTYAALAAAPADIGSFTVGPFASSTNGAPSTFAPCVWGRN
jgi:hypothetical protein